MFQKTIRKSIFEIVLLTIIIFIIEIITPQGVGEAILYVGVILVGLSSQNKRIIYGTVMVSSILTIVGYFVSPVSVEPWKSVTNRFFDIIVFWIIAFVGLKRLQVEERLSKSEERYRSVLDNMMEGAQIISFDWRYLYVNEEVIKQGRQTKKNLLGHTMMEMYPGIENTEVFVVIKKCMQNRTAHMMENEFIYPDGTKGWFELSIQPVEEGVFILSNNITERKLAEKELYELNVELEERVRDRTDALESSLSLISSLYQVVQSAINYRSLPEMLQSIVKIISTTLSADRATVILFNHEKKQVTHLVKAGNGSEQVIESISYAELMEGLSGWALRELKPAISSKEIPDPRESLIAQQRRLETNCGSIVVLPLLYHGEAFGTMTIINTPQQSDFTNQEITWLQAIANQAALAIGRAQIYNQLDIANNSLNQRNSQLQKEITQRKQVEEKILQQNKMLAKLHQITLDLLKQYNLEQLLKKIVELSTEFLDAEYGEIMLVENNALIVKAATQNQQHIIGEIANRQEALLSWQAVDTLQPVILKDYSTWEHRREVYSKFSLHATADFPILNNETSIGVLAFGRSKPNYEFTPEQIQFGSLFASLTALIIINSQLRETLKQQSIHDALTGLFNRRYMEETLKQELSRAARQNHPLVIIMLDIDHFKNFNDSFGHLAGDALLSQLGQFLQTNIRMEDTVCRYGGEEFLLIMPNVSLETAKSRAELLREGISQFQLDSGDITISFGITSYPQQGKTMDALIHSADKALYRAKENGRNRVEVAT